jgi:hypothetical protein
VGERREDKKKKEKTPGGSRRYTTAAALRAGAGDRAPCHAVRGGGWTEEENEEARKGAGREPGGTRLRLRSAQARGTVRRTMRYGVGGCTE